MRDHGKFGNATNGNATPSDLAAFGAPQISLKTASSALRVARALETDVNGQLERANAALTALVDRSRAIAHAVREAENAVIEAAAREEG